jgi:hypothetical protein
VWIPKRLFIRPVAGKLVVAKHPTTQQRRAG